MYGTLETAIQLRVSQLCEDLSRGHSDLSAAGASSSPTSTSASSLSLPTATSATAATSSTSGLHQQQAPSKEAGGSGSSSSSSSSSSGDPSQGRLGPKSVSIDSRHASGQLAYGPGGLTIESLANFSSCRATACVYAGLWQYEVTVLTSGIQQLGWCTALCPFTAEEGVGDAADSYAFDGKRLRKWSVKCSPYGQAWTPGDVIGCCIDLDKREASFYRNGVSLGVAFTNIRTMQPHLAYFPAVSISYTERCKFNFGAMPFEHPVSRYTPLQAPPEASDSATAGYLVNCLQRLALFEPESEQSTDGPASAAAAAPGSSSSSSSITSAPAQTPSQLEIASLSPNSGSGARISSVPTIPSDDWILMAGVITARLLPLLQLHSYLPSPPHPPPTAAPPPSPPTPSRRPTLRPHPPLAPPVTPPRASPAAAAAPPAASTAAAAAVGAPTPESTPLSRALDLLVLCSHQASSEQLFRALLESLACKTLTSPVAQGRAPDTPASAPYLRLAAGLVRNPGVRSAWVRHPNFLHLTECLLARKSPSMDDMVALVPAVWWPGSSCPEPPEAQARMDASLASLTASVSQVEELQYQLIAPLMTLPSYSDPRQSSLEEFLGHLVQKNRGCNRDVPPPGLSDQSVLISTFFVLLRFLQSALYSLDSCPVGGLFVKTAWKGDAEPVNDLGRLGGVVTHLAREVTIRPAELEPTMLHPAPRLHAAAPSAAAAAVPLSRVPHLLQAAMTLYSFKLGSSMRVTHAVERGMSASIGGLMDVERAMAAAAAPVGPTDYLAYLQEARRFFLDDVVTNVRFGGVLKAVFFSGWKQGALFTLCAWLSHLLSTLAAQQGALLSYIPTCYTDAIVDFMKLLLKADNRSQTIQALLPHGLHDIIGLLAVLLHDTRICNPEVKVSLISCVANLLGSQEFLSAFEANEVARLRLLPAVVSCLDTQGWHPAPAILQRLIGGGGFGQPQGEYSSPVFRQLLSRSLPLGSNPCKVLVHRLLETCNWVVTEFTITVSELFESRNSGRRQMSEVQQQYRKAGDMVDACAGLLRLIEVVVLSMPDAFLQPPLLNFNKLLEVLTFVLSHFTVGADARKLQELLAPLPSPTSGASGSALSSLVRLERDMLAAKVGKAAVLAPVLGCLLALWPTPPPHHRSTPTAGTASSIYTTPGKPEAARPPPVPVPVPTRAEPPAASGLNVPTDVSSAEAQLRPRASRTRAWLLSNLGRHYDARLRRHVAHLAGLDWRGLMPVEGVAQDLAEFLTLVAALEKSAPPPPSPSHAASPGRSPASAGAAAAAAAGADTEGPAAATPTSESEVPEEFLDPITTEVMTDPVVLPDSQVTLDRSTVERHLMTSTTDPFSRTDLTMEACQPDRALAVRIQAWVQLQSSKAAAALEQQ
ncbi:MAG: hypothetical protein WDW36_002626 [Sanguina aurantia]